MLSPRSPPLKYLVLLQIFVLLRRTARDLIGPRGFCSFPHLLVAVNLWQVVWLAARYNGYLAAGKFKYTDEILALN